MQLEISDIAETPATSGYGFCLKVATEFLLIEMDALFIKHIFLSSVGNNASREGHATLAAAAIGRACLSDGGEG